MANQKIYSMNTREFFTCAWHNAKLEKKLWCQHRETPRVSRQEFREALEDVCAVYRTNLFARQQQYYTQSYNLDMVTVEDQIILVPKPANERVTWLETSVERAARSAAARKRKGEPDTLWEAFLKTRAA